MCLPIADDINDNIHAIGLTPLGCVVEREAHRLRIVSVGMVDGSTHDLSED